MKWKAYGRYGSVGFELLASIAIGYWIGRYLDGAVGGGRGYLTALFSVAGVYAGFRALFKAAAAMTRDIEREEKLGRGESPWRVPMPDEEPDPQEHDEPDEPEEPANADEPSDKTQQEEHRKP